jgi:hypothetical protein
VCRNCGCHATETRATPDRADQLRASSPAERCFPRIERLNVLVRVRSNLACSEIFSPTCGPIEHFGQLPLSLLNLRTRPLSSVGSDRITTRVRWDCSEIQRRMAAERKACRCWGKASRGRECRCKPGPLSNKSPKSLRQGQRQLSQWGRWLHLLVRCSRDNAH